MAKAQTTRVLVASNGHYKVHDPVEYKMWKREERGACPGPTPLIPTPVARWPQALSTGLLCCVKDN